MTSGSSPRAVLFDRDGTLVVDVPYNGDPALVVPMPGAVEAVALVRAAGLPIGVVTNQSGIARGIVTRAQVDAVNAAVDALFGGFDVWQLCPHGPGDGCDCRKPAPGMVLRAAEALSVDPADVVLIGDLGTDLGAAHAARARAVLVPTAATPQAHRDEAGAVASDLAEAIRVALAGDAR